MIEEKTKINPRVSDFARELAVALRRITGREVENTPNNLPKPITRKTSQLLSKPKK